MAPAIHGEVAFVRLRFCFGGMTAAAPLLSSSARIQSMSKALSPSKASKSISSIKRLHANAVMALSRQKDKARQIAKRIDKGDDLRRQASSRRADGLMASPPFAPVPCLWTLTIVPSTMAYPKSGSPDKLLNILSKTPFPDHRRKRRNTVFQHPKTSGKSRHGAPVRTIILKQLRAADAGRDRVLSRVRGAPRTASFHRPDRIGGELPYSHTANE